MNSKRKDKNKEIKNDSIFERKGRLNYRGHQWHRSRRSGGLCTCRGEVVVSGRREAEGSETLTLIKNFGGEGKFVQGDITSEVDIAAMVKTTVDTFGRSGISCTGIGGAMDLIVTGVVAGVLGTLVMDSLNHLFARIGVISKIDVGIIGRMAVGWTQGRFMYRHPDEMECVPNEIAYGYFTHYAIGVGFAVPFVLGWDLLVGGPASPVWAFVYGVATTVASLFLVYPSMGFGMLGRRSPEGIKSPISSLANHSFFGVGMAVAVALA